MNKMVAMVAPSAGAKLERVERDIPAPGPSEILLKVFACGVCHSDSFTVEGTRPGIVYPRIPGHEVIGTVLAFGNEVRGWKVGDHVGVGWFGGSCGYCFHCRRADSFACLNMRASTGLTRDGGYATHMLADASAAAHLPSDLDSVQSAPMLCAGVTTFNALRHSGATPGDLVAVYGVGGLGHLAIQFARHMGFRTIAINRGHDKEKLAIDLGAHEYLASDEVPIADELQKRGGARVIISTVASSEALESIVDGLGINGVLMVIGAAGDVSVNTLALMGKRAAVRGWYTGVATDSEDTVAFGLSSGTKPMTEIFDFADAQAAYERMMSGQAHFRVVLRMDLPEVPH